jgi:hypothetical protein
MITIHIDFKSGSSIDHVVGNYEHATWYLCGVAPHDISKVYVTESEDM